MGATSRERYAVVSCHVERPLDDVVWGRFAALQEAKPGGYSIAALVRPPDPAFGEDEDVWLGRVRGAAALGPLGHHTHWTAPDHARPTAFVADRHELEPGVREGRAGAPATDHGKAGARVQEEATRLRRAGIAPTLFCGGGWYTDVEVAEACAELGYVDCTPRAARPSYLAEGERWASLATPTAIELPSGRTLAALPTTHSLGDSVRALVRRELPAYVHVYFHDTDLLDRGRRALLGTVLGLLSRRTGVSDLDALGARVLPGAPRVPWDDVARL
jgi:hypothetical protein